MERPRIYIVIDGIAEEPIGPNEHKRSEYAAIAIGAVIWKALLRKGVTLDVVPPGFDLQLDIDLRWRPPPIPGWGAGK